MQLKNFKMNHVLTNLIYFITLQGKLLYELKAWA